MGEPTAADIREMSFTEYASKFPGRAAEVRTRFLAEHPPPEPQPEPDIAELPSQPPQRPLSPEELQKVGMHDWERFRREVLGIGDEDLGIFA